MTTLTHAVANLRGLVERTLARLIGGRGVDALVAFPNGPNAGDNAIYLGQLACLQSLGIARPRVICDYRTYDRRAVAQALRGGVILLAGGGSFGDLWPIGQSCREDILRAFPDNPVIQLPQSMHFAGRPALDRARAAVDGHHDLTLLWRDQRSLELGRREFNAESELCPDMAFSLGPLDRPRTAGQPVVWISRTDRERSAVPLPGAPGVTDWPEDRDTPLRRANYMLMGAAMRFPRQKVWRTLLMQTYSPLAWRRLRIGLHTIAAGQTVITDRLHGHILAMLLGIPSVLLDNSYGKLSSFHDTWTREVDGVQFARSSDEALTLAEQRLGKSVAVGNQHGRR